VAACPNCGSENVDGANFCSVCGTRLTGASTNTAEVRKTVTIVFCDVTGSTELGERLDPESLRKVMVRYFDVMRGVLERHGGSVEKFIGDAVMAVFGIPQLHEDDALRAVRAAAQMRASLDELNRELEPEHGVELACRIGVNTGEVLVGAEHAERNDFGRLTGDPVNTAARLEAAAEPGQILIGAETHRLVEDAVEDQPLDPLSLKGKERPVPAYRLVRVLSEVGQARRALTSAMVGRERELEDLTRAFARATDDRSCLLFTILGAAGEGKTRLVEEFLSTVGDSATVVSGRCLPYGEGITYWPVAEAIRSALDVQAFDPPEEVAARLAVAVSGDEHAPAVAGRLAEVLGLGEGIGSAEETPWAIRRFLEILATERPLVAVWEDVHWAEPAFLDVVDHVVDWSRNASIMLVCTARPEFLDTRSGWGGGKLNATTVSLQPLDPAASAELIANLIGDADLPPDASERLTEAAGGNPLFVEQMLSMMIDDGQLVQHNGGWTTVGDLHSVSVPPTVAALLAARLERLGEPERRAVECASVIGKEFYVGAVQELLPEPLRTGTGDLVLSLVRKGLVLPDRSAISGEDAFRFRHILIRDAAYNAIPKERRAELHERFADWIVGVAGDRASEQDEIVGYHLELALRYREALGPLDDRARELAGRASDRLASAARRALGRHDLQAVANLLGRAETLLDPADPSRIALLPDLAIALWEVGSSEAARAVEREAIGRADELGDPEVGASVTLARWYLREDFKGEHDRARSDAMEAITIFEHSGNEGGLTRAWQLIGSVEWDLGQAGKQLAALDRALDHARLAGSTFDTAEVLLNTTASLVRGPTPVPEGIERAEAILDGYRGNRAAEAYTGHALAHLRARLEDFDGARDAVARYRGFFQDTGQVLAYWYSAEVSFDVEMLAGNADAANAVAEEAWAALLEHDIRWAYLAAFLAQSRLALGRLDEASDAAADAVTSSIAIERALGLGVLARIAGTKGDPARAQEQIGEAVAIVEQTDFLFDRGTVYLDQAAVLGTIGRAEESRAALERALSEFERKGDVVSARRIRALLETPT
jgi:class 3 adenylate cyclase/tetratricopeptide (TPR) repeat protein